MRRQWLVAATVWALAGPGFPAAFGQGVKNEQVWAAYSAYERASIRGPGGKPVSPRERKAMADRLLADLGVERLTAGQLLHIIQAASESSKAQDVRKRLEKLAEDQGPDGALASVALLEYHRDPRATGPEGAAPLATALGHPGMAKAAATGFSCDILSHLSMFTLEHRDAVGLLTEDLAKPFETLSMPAIASMRMFIGNVAQAEVPARNLEPLRQAMVGAVKRWRRELNDNDKLYDYTISMGNSPSSVRRDDEQFLINVRIAAAGSLDEIARQLDGLAGRGEGQPAPPLDIEWASGREGNADLHDFKGQVVILVSWYRWPTSDSGAALCKALEERYAGKPVIVVPLTSVLVGALYGNGGMIDPGGTKDQQKNSARKTAAEAGMKSPVGFVEDSVLNGRYATMYGHAAVVDGSGILRATNLGSDQKQKLFEMIDGLLGAATTGAGDPSPPAKP